MLSLSPDTFAELRAQIEQGEGVRGEFKTSFENEIINPSVLFSCGRSTIKNNRSFFEIKMDAAANTLFGKTRQAVLTLLFEQPTERFYLREIAKITNISSGALQKELGQLHAADLVVRAEDGNRVTYQANAQHPIFGELQSIVAKTCGLSARLPQPGAPDEVMDKSMASTPSALAQSSEAYLRSIFLARLPQGAKVYLFGSRARGDARWNSDYDFWIDCAVDRNTLLEIEETLEESFVPFHVDLVTTAQLNGRFGEIVKQEAKRWL